MPEVLASPEVSILDFPARKRWTRSELRQLIDEGHEEFERYELFDGELINKRGKNRPHVMAVHRTVACLRQVFGYEFVMQESPINLRPEDEALYRPEPDAIVLRQDCAEFEDADPGPQHIQLAVEISDTSLRFDLAAKSRAYARAAIPEYWVVDANGRRLIVHREPSGAQYRSVKSYAVGEEIAPLSRPAARIEIAAFFR
jgi:Uma2 family endonuclease